MTLETGGQDDASEMLELLGGLLNGTLTSTEQARLNHLLREEPWARVLYRRYINLHAALHVYHTTAPATDCPPADVGTREEGGEPAIVRRPRSERAAEPQPRRMKKSRTRRPLALAAGVLALAGLSWLGVSNPRLSVPFSSEGPVVGILSAAHGSVRVQGARGEQRAEVGMELHTRDTLTVPADASAVLALDGAIRAEVGAKTTLAFSSETGKAKGRSLYLQKGFLAVEAGPQPPGRPLRVFTPDGRAEILGTKFTLAATPRQTRLRVAEGAVSLRSGSVGSSVVVPAGFGSGIADGVAMPLSPSRSGEVLLVESLEKSKVPGQWGRFNREMASRLLSERIRRLALKVAIKNHRDVQASDLVGRPLVIVSVAEENVGFEESLRRIGLAEAAVPVLCLEPLAFPALGMTGPKQGVDFAWMKPPALVWFALPNHPLSGGQAGLTRLPVSFAWGRPSAQALRIATLDGHPERAVLFAYDAGKQMIGRKAPARRVGFFLEPVIVDRPDAASWNLFEDAVNWCVEPAANRQPADGN